MSFDFKESRKMKNMTQSKLALKLKVDQTTVSKWEVGDAIPSVKKMVEISNVLDVPLEDVVQYFTQNNKTLQMES